MKDLTGENIGRYKIVSEIGHGGMAVVYRAIDTTLDRNVAIKVILPEVSHKEKLLRRFNREAKTLANLSHPNIVKVLDYGEYEGSPYLVMEYISGGTLKASMGKPMNYAQAAALLVPVARALNYAHQQKIVHRDVKPDNILINESGQPMLSDFGILKLVDLEESQGLTGTGKIVGTPAYMSPEQIRGREIDGRADIYSLGIVFFEMVAGRKPYTANTPIELSMQHLHDPIPKAKQFVRDLPATVEQVIVKSMAKNPEDRYASMLAFAQDLEKLSGTTTRITSERKAVTPKDEPKPEGKKQNRLIVPLFVVAALLIVGGIGTVLFGKNLPFLGNAPTATNTAPATNQPIPATVAATNTKAIAAPTSTPPPSVSTSTPTPTFSLVITTPSATPEIVLATSNVARISEINRIDRISVIKIDWIESGNLIIDAGSSLLLFIDPQTAVIKQRVNLTDEIPLSMGYSPATNKLYLLFSTYIKVFDAQSYKLLNTFQINAGAYSLAVSPDGKLIALGILDNKVQLLSTDDGRVMRTLRSNYGGWSVAFSPDSNMVVGGTSQGILMWETNSGLWLPSTGGESSSIQTLTFSRDGKMLAGGSKDVIYVWDAANGNLLYELTLATSFGEVNGLDFSPDGTILVTGSDDGIIRIWNTSNGSLLREIKGHTSSIFGIRFSPAGQYFASGANEGSIKVWGIP